MSKEKTELERVSPSSPIESAARDEGGLRPYYPPSYGYGYGYGYEDDDEKANLRKLWKVIRKRKWMILSIALIVTTLVTIEMYRTRNTFQASAMVEIGREVNLIGKVAGEDVYDWDYMVSIKTKMLMVKSQPLLETVVLDNKLYQDPRFLENGGKQSFIEAVKLLGAKVGLAADADTEQEKKSQTVTPIIFSDNPSARTPEEKATLERCIGVLEGGISVEPVKDTRVIRISFTHTNPEITALVTNSVAEAFINQNFETKTQKYTASAKWLDETSRKFQARLREAEEALATYTRDHGIFTTDQDGTLTTSKLQRLHDEALRAETERTLKQSLYEEVKQGRIAQLPEAYTDTKQSRIPDLQKQLGQLEAELSELNLKLGPENPRIRDLQQRIIVTREQINSGTRSLEERLKMEYERALRDEKNFKALLAQAKGDALQQNQDAIQYNILKQNVETNKSLYQEFLQKTNQAQAQVVEQQNNLRMIEPAKTPGGLVGPRRFPAIMMALVLSLAAGVGIAFFLDYLDNTIKTVEDVSRYTQLPALSVVPTVSGRKLRTLSSNRAGLLKAAGMKQIETNSSAPLVTLDPRSSVAEAYRVLRTSVLLSAAGKPPRTILITSGQPAEGKTTTAINTAISLAQTGARVLLIDCDLRRPNIHKVLGLDHAQGLSTCLTSDVAPDEVIQKLPIGNLSLLSSGPLPPNPAELIISDRMKQLICELAERYDHILIDSPPLMNVTDPVILSTMVDGVILVVHGGRSSRDLVRRARQELTNVGAKIFGVVLNNIDLKREGYDYYYYYDRYYSDRARDDSQRDAGPKSG